MCIRDRYQRRVRGTSATAMHRQGSAGFSPHGMQSPHGMGGPMGGMSPHGMGGPMGMSPHGRGGMGGMGMGGMGMQMGMGGGMGHMPPNWHNPFERQQSQSAPPCSAPCSGKPCGGGVGNNKSCKFSKELGKGKFGETWLVDYKGKECAAKVTCCPQGFRPIETEMLRKAQGPFTCVFYGQEDKTPKGTAIIMKCYPRNMEQRITETRAQHPGKRKGMPKRDYIQALEQLAQGLEWLHGHDIMFGDLKPDNILYDEDQDLFVFADFGDSRNLTAQTTGKRVSRPQEVGWGHPQYHCIPDVMSASSDFKSDLWMLAQTAIHLWTGAEPKHNPDRLPSNIPLKDILQSCYNSRPGQRPSASEFLKAVRQFKDNQHWDEETASDDHIDDISDKADENRRSAAIALAMAEGKDAGEEFQLYKPEEGETHYSKIVDSGARTRSKSRHSENSYGMQSGADAAAAKSARSSGKLPSEWAEAKDKQGRTYYWNKRTKATTWTKPKAEKKDEAAMEDALMGDLNNVKKTIK
eukprot:TRINITY_DN14176_c0_g11_i1.p1 TRINITY_DN14176_c0_g11~~TRINITY_DN14176_c0_g11_i1.p1  ORF type:complete len:522 (-),score=101.30 TRINITY_DN14176_c0_g11_i1:147-1712(-)